MIFRGLTLDPFQEEAISAVAEGRSVLVCAPTGTGKTIIADYVVDRALSRERDVIYTAPVKALSNQKFRDWTRLYGPDRIGLLTGDLVIRRDARCRVMTTEILRNMLLQGEELPELDAVIIDEIHFLDDRERGTTWEELLIYLPHRVQIVGLSATLSNAERFATWISDIRETKVHVVRQEKRTVPLEPWIANLDEGLLPPADFDKAWARWSKKRPARSTGGRHRGGPTTSHIDVFDMLADRDLLPCLYFQFSRKATEQCARNLALRVRRSLLDRAQEAEVRARLDALSKADPALVDEDLRGLYLSGIAFHHAGLHVQLKAFVEELYESRLIKVLYCTSTFALGINMPARSVVFDSLRKFDGISLRPLTTREFLQKAGRAGRRGMDTVGHVVIRMDHGDWEVARDQLAHYFAGKSEPVRSSFSLSFNSVVNLLARNPMDRIREIVEKSFLNFHRQQEAQRLLTEAETLADSGKKGAKEAARMRHRAASRATQCWEEFQAKVTFLQQIGYLGENLELQAGGRALQYIQIEEIFLTELFLSGLLEDLPADLLFGLMCSVNKEFGRDVRIRVKFRPEILTLGRAADKVRWSSTVTKAEELSGMSVTWCPDMIHFGSMWAQGKSFAELLTHVDSLTDISGDLVGAFRRAKDLAGQLKDVYAYDDEKKAMLADLIRAVSRDEVLVVD